MVCDLICDMPITDN